MIDLHAALHTLADLDLLAESVSLECKLAHGRDGKGELPNDFWPTYSSMANTHGGLVLLGIRESKGKFTVAGIENPEKIRKDLFSTLNDPRKASVNLLTDAQVETITLDGKMVLAIQVPAAGRKQKPVYINGNPLGNTYRRLNEGDMRLSDEAVRRMLAEQVEDDRDARILPGFGLADLDPDSLRIYRQMLTDKNPGHPFLEHQGEAFLQQMGAWRRDRQSDAQGLTLAGLLMFGTWPAIQEAVPHYFVDYQERPEAKTELRWVDRLVPDGTWSGNAFDFFRRVYRKLVADLKVPFALKDGQRQDDTPVHVALREALVNALVHADYTGRVSIMVVKRPDLFGFRNPGCLRLPLEQVLQGGTSDCRNRLMHQMFLMIGMGERGGSGIPKIFSGWQSQHWRQPVLREVDEPEQTLLELHMLDLLPESVLTDLRQRFGDKFNELERGERLILVTAAIEQVVNHARLADICGLHASDLSHSLARLVREGMLESKGQSRGKVYYLPGATHISPDQVFPAAPGSSGHNGASSGHNETRSGYSGASSGHNDASSGHTNLNPGADDIDSGGTKDAPRDGDGCLVSTLLDAPIIEDLSLVSAPLLAELQERATEARNKQRLPPSRMQEIILAVCRERYLTLNVLAQLLSRNPEALRKQYLNAMVKSGHVCQAFPMTPTHEKQAYRSASRVQANNEDSEGT